MLEIDLVDSNNLLVDSSAYENIQKFVFFLIYQPWNHEFLCRQISKAKKGSKNLIMLKQ